VRVGCRGIRPFTRVGDLCSARTTREAPVDPHGEPDRTEPDDRDDPCEMSAMALDGKECSTRIGVTSAGMIARITTVHDHGCRPRAITQPPTAASRTTAPWSSTKRQKVTGCTTLPAACCRPKVTHRRRTTHTSVKAPSRRHPDVGRRTTPASIEPRTSRNCTALSSGASEAIVPA
jgi:hypothetical protein